MFLHLLIGEFQITPAVARHLGNQYNSLQCMKLEVVHQNQLTEYGLVSKDSKIENLFPFQQTIHIPIELNTPALDDEIDLHGNSNLQKLSFTIFAILNRENMVKLGSGVFSSALSKDFKVLNKTVVIRSDQLEIMGKIAVTTAYHDSLMDISDFIQLKKYSGSSQKEKEDQEYSFLLSRKFRRSTANFPSTFDNKLDRKIREDSEYYIESIQKSNKNRSSTDLKRAGSAGHQQSKASPNRNVRSSSTGVLSRSSRPPSSNAKSFGRSIEKSQTRRPNSVTKPHKQFADKEQHLTHQVDPPKLRKTVMSVGFVHNTWPNPLDHEREKREYQLRMADEKKQWLLQQIREEIEQQRHRNKLAEQHHRELLEIKTEKRRKKLLTKELQHREVEIKRLQEELHKIRLQSILAAQQSTPPPPQRSRSPTHYRATTTSSSEKKRSGSADKARKGHALREGKVNKPSAHEQRINQLISQGYSNFFKQNTPSAHGSSRKSSTPTKASPSKPITQKKKQEEKRSISPIARSKGKEVKKRPAVTPVAETSATANRSSQQGNEVIKVSITRHPSPKVNAHPQRPSTLQQRYLDLAAKQRLSRQSKDRPRAGSEFEFQDIYRHDLPHQSFDSDHAFAELNERYSKSAPKDLSWKKLVVTSASSQQQVYNEDLESTHLLEDNEDEVKVFEDSIEEEIKAINQAIQSDSNDDTPPRVDESLQSESTSGVAYAPPGFLQGLVHQTTVDQATYPLADRREQQQEQLYPASYYADIDIEEDDIVDLETEEDDDSDSNKADTTTIHHPPHLYHPAGETLLSDPMENITAISNDDEEDADIRGMTRIYPPQDFQYSDNNFTASKAMTTSPAVIFSESDTSDSEEDERLKTARVGKDMVISADILQGDSSSEDEQNKVTAKEEKEEEDWLKKSQKYEFEYRLSRSSSSAGTSSRSRSRDKIVQQFEKNRQYSRERPSVPRDMSPSSERGNLLSTTISSLSNTSAAPIPTTTLTTTSSSMLSMTSRVDNEDEEITYSQLDILIEKTTEAVTQAIRKVASDDDIAEAIDLKQSSKPSSTINTKKKTTGKTAHQYLAGLLDTSGSDDDTVENNILDTVTFNAKLLKSFPHEDSSDSFEEKEVSNSLHQSSKVETERVEEKNDNTPSASQQDLQEKLNRVSQRIGSFTSAVNRMSTPNKARTPRATSDERREGEGEDEKSLGSARKGVSFSREFHTIHEIPARTVAEPSEAPVTPSSVTIDYSKPTSHYGKGHHRSLIERQFEKNRRYSSQSTVSATSTGSGIHSPAPSGGLQSSTTPLKKEGGGEEESLPVISSHVNPQTLHWNDDSPTVTNKDLKSNYTIELPATKSDAGVTGQTSHSPPSSATTAASTLAKEVSLHISPFHHQKSSSEDNSASFDTTPLPVQPPQTFIDSNSNDGNRVQSIISQFEKNRRYSNLSTTSNTTSTITASESISHPGLKLSPKISKQSPIRNSSGDNNGLKEETTPSAPLSSSEAKKSEEQEKGSLSQAQTLVFPITRADLPSASSASDGKTMKLDGPSPSSEVITSTVNRGDLQYDWQSLEAALDKLETRVKSTDVRTKKEKQETEAAAGIAVDPSPIDNQEKIQAVEDSFLSNKEEDQSPAVSSEVIQQRRMSARLILDDTVKKNSFSDSEEEEEDEPSRLKEADDHHNNSDDDDDDTNSSDREIMRQFMNEMEDSDSENDYDHKTIDKEVAIQ